MNLKLTILISGGVMLSGGIKIICQSNYEGSLDFYIGIFSTLVGEMLSPPRFMIISFFLSVIFK
mgnify:CR=1 FL=1